MDRRYFLKSGIAGAAGLVAGSTSLLTWAPRAYAAIVNVNINAVAGSVDMPDGSSAYMLCFSSSNTPQFHGPTIVVQDGDTVNVNLANSLSIDTVFAVTGTGIKEQIAAGGTTSFSFNAPAPGTYLYYDDQNNGVNRVMGLNGILVVMPNSSNQSFSGGPSFTRQYKWALHTIDVGWGNTVQTSGHSAVNSLDPDSFNPYFFTLNGTSFPYTQNPNTVIEGNIGEPALIRLVNSGGMIHSPHFHANHVEITSINRENFTGQRKEKDIVSMMPLDARDVIFPFKTPPDAWPSASGVQRYPMHCHSEMSQTRAGGMYPDGLHTGIVIGQSPATEPKL